MATAKNPPGGQDGDKFFDITKPGQSAASASSRPLIVGHKPMLKDPMVKDKAVNELEEDKSVKIDQPFEDDLLSGSPPVVDEASPEPADKKTAPPSESKSIFRPFSDKKDQKQTTKVKTKDSASPAIKPAKTDDKPISQPNAKDTDVEKLIDSKQYFVPIGEKSRQSRSNRRIITWSLIGLLLGLALIYLMIDVGLIKTNIKLPFEFFKDEPVATTTPPTSTNQSTTKPTNPPAPTYKIPEGYVLYENKDAGFKFAYPKKWIVNLEKPDKCGAYAIPFDGDDEPDIGKVKCISNGNIWAGAKTDNKEVVNISVFANSPKTLDQLFTIDSTGNDVKAARYTAYGLKAYKFTLTTADYTENTWVIELKKGNYIRFSNREFTKNHAAGNPDLDLREYTADVKKIADTLAPL